MHEPRGWPAGNRDYFLYAPDARDRRGIVRLFLIKASKCEAAMASGR
jgi:hypothetical protein